MGEEAGLPARILALREGSALAYATVAAATAPGQVSLDEMIHLYRAHALTRRTRVYGVIGDPVDTPSHPYFTIPVCRASYGRRLSPLPCA